MEGVANVVVVFTKVSVVIVLLGTVRISSALTLILVETLAISGSDVVGFTKGCEVVASVGGSVTGGGFLFPEIIHN